MVTRCLALFCLFLTIGCTPERVITIRTNPPNSTIRIDNETVSGPGPVVQRLLFRRPDVVYRISASAPGYKEAVDTVTLNSERTEVFLELKRDTRRINVLVEPAPAIVKLDGERLAPDRVSAISREVELGLDERNVPVTRVLSAERENFKPASRTISALDRDLAYTLTLQPMRKSISITTNPPGAEIFLDEEKRGVSPLTIPDLPFMVDLQTDQFIQRQIRAEKNGYDSAQLILSWDDGRTDYPVDLPVKEKEIRLFVDPPGAAITIDGEQVANDTLGVTVRTLTFPPVNEQGDLKSYEVAISKKTADAEWEPRTFTLAWEGGRSDYRVALKEILTMSVPQLSAIVQRGQQGWTMAARRSETVAMREIGEPIGESQPRKITQLAKGTQLDSLAIAPDGSRLVFAVVSVNGMGDLRSQIFVLSADGSGAARDVTDGQSLDLMPTFSPGGEHVVYSSNRDGTRMQIWSVPIGGGDPTRLTQQDALDLWPSVDSDPRPRLFSQAMVDSLPDPRMQVGPVGMGNRIELVALAGTQPRISPRNDSVLFCGVDASTGKRDIFRVSDRGGEPINLTRTPDVDEFDPAWGRDGRHILFTADRAVDDGGRHNFDIWMLDLDETNKPLQLTRNGSVDDCPVFDVLGTSIYFRSNRGGEWAIWKIGLK